MFFWGGGQSTAAVIVLCLSLSMWCPSGLSTASLKVVATVPHKAVILLLPTDSTPSWMGLRRSSQLVYSPREMLNGGSINKHFCPLLSIPWRHYWTVQNWSISWFVWKAQDRARWTFVKPRPWRDTENGVCSIFKSNKLFSASWHGLGFSNVHLAESWAFQTNQFIHVVPRIRRCTYGQSTKTMYSLLFTGESGYSRASANVTDQWTEI